MLNVALKEPIAVSGTIENELKEYLADSVSRLAAYVRKKTAEATETAPVLEETVRAQGNGF
ncbi:MAG: hypothetical protein ACM3S5_13460 [Rhodospirillales bacterium]